MSGFANFAAAAVVLSLGVVTGCGGGGGGGGSSTPSTTPTPMMSNFPVASAAEARMLTDGVSTTAMTTTQIENTLEAIGRVTDTVLASDFYVVPEGGGIDDAFTVAIDCTGFTAGRGTCSAVDTTTGLGSYNNSADLTNLGTNFDGERMVVMERNDVVLWTEFDIFPDTEELYSQTYGGWLDASAFAVEGFIEQAASENFFVIGAISIGNDTGMNPDANGTWNGVMVGAQLNRSAQRIDVVQGDATVTADISASTVDVSFTRIRNLDTGGSVANIRFDDVSMTSGSFSHISGANTANERSIEGAFYGANHAEVGGVFGDSPRNIGGAFGAARATQ